MKISITVSLLFICLTSINCTQGIDVDQPLSTSTFSCIKSNGNLFAIVRGMTPNGQIVPKAGQTLTNAAAAGMLTDMLITPCRARSAQNQAEQALNKINKQLYDTVWIQVAQNDSPGCSWYNFEPATNCEFLNQMAKIITGRGKHVGIFSSREAWMKIFKFEFGCPSLSHYEIWYASGDGEPNFSDFADFGGWDFPRLKQFSVNTTICGARVNKNYHSSA